MTKRFSKWAADQGVSIGDLANALEEVEQGNFEASLGGNQETNPICGTR
jgi:hypothetical protein